MSSVFQFRSVTLIALTQICGSNHRASDFSFFQQTHNVQISPYILLVLYKVTFENRMVQTLFHHYLVILLVHKQLLPVVSQVPVLVNLLLILHQILLF